MNRTFRQGLLNCASVIAQQISLGLWLAAQRERE